MISNEMRKWGRPIAAFTQKRYNELKGRLKECLPKHVPTEIEQVGKRLRLWSMHPRAALKAVEKAKRRFREEIAGKRKARPKKKKAAKPKPKAKKSAKKKRKKK